MVKTKPTLVLHKAFLPATLGIYLLISILIRIYLFPLKVSMHWDEILRYTYPGVNLFSYNLEELFASFTRNLDNGQVTIFILRVIRNFFPNHPSFVFMIYKYFVTFFTLFSVVSLGRIWQKSENHDSPAVSVPIFMIALSPMVWLQANEIMTEPIAFPISLFWVGKFMTWAKLSKERKRPKFGVFLGWVFFGILFILTSLQYFIIYSSACLAALGLASILSSQGKLKFSVLFQTLFAPIAVVVTTFLFWALIHIEFGLENVFYRIFILFQESSKSYSSLSLGMNFFDIGVFGIRSFFWLYLPAYLLLIPMGLALKVKFKDFSNSYQFLLILTFLLIPLFAYGYKGNNQERYHYLSNGLLLFSSSTLIYEGLPLIWNRVLKLLKRLHLTGKGVKRSLFVALSVYFIMEYYPLYEQTPCFANFGSYGNYDEDQGTCDESKSVFGLVPRRLLVKFPHISRALNFPNSVGNLKTDSLKEVFSKIRASLIQGYAPVALSNNPNFFQSPNPELMYLEKFGEYPPPREHGRILFISLSFPETSKFMSVVYYLLEEKSEAKALAQWHLLETSPRWEPGLMEINRNYDLRIAKYQ